MKAFKSNPSIQTGWMMTRLDECANIEFLLNLIMWWTSWLNLLSIKSIQISVCWVSDAEWTMRQEEHQCHHQFRQWAVYHLLILCIQEITLNFSFRNQHWGKYRKWRTVAIHRPNKRSTPCIGFSPRKRWQLNNNTLQTQIDSIINSETLLGFHMMDWPRSWFG